MLTVRLARGTGKAAKGKAADAVELDLREVIRLEFGAGSRAFAHGSRRINPGLA